MTWNILEGDCVALMAGMEAASVDAVVCDPPYSLGFMSKPWDMQVDHGRWATEALRVLKPGGHLLAFGGTRTYHRLACALEDAGFEIRDCLVWLYGSGFPKSLDVSKAIDRLAGAEREVVGTKLGQPGYSATQGNGDHLTYGTGLGNTSDGVREAEVTAAATEDAKRWEGWGTALKPAHEPIVLARKPLSGTVAGNVLEHGTGGLNVDGCRIGATGGGGNGLGSHFDRLGDTDPLVRHGDDSTGSVGRWPANVILDEPAAALLDEQTGERGSYLPAGTVRPDSTSPTIFGQAGRPDVFSYGDSGGASRFFYMAKSSRAERNAGLDGFAVGDRVNFGSGGRSFRGGEWVELHTEPRKRANHHPTVKPVSLMRWLVRLVTPPGGLVLDPFAGSGTTGVAAVLEGFRFVGLEREPEYCELAKARIAWWLEHGEDALRIVAERERAEAERLEVAAAGQLELLADGIGG